MNKKVIIIPDSFKGSLTSEEAAAILKKSAEKAGFEALAFPIADGGEGSVNSILSVKGGTRFFKTVTGPEGNDIEAMYGITSDNIAVIEIAESSGITKQKEPHPMTAGTFGFGSLIRDALDRGARKFLLCLGGSASTDCGTGMAAALGVLFLNEKKESFADKKMYLDYALDRGYAFCQEAEKNDFWGVSEQMVFAMVKKLEKIELILLTEKEIRRRKSSIRKIFA